MNFSQLFELQSELSKYEIYTYAMDLDDIAKNEYNSIHLHKSIQEQNNSKNYMTVDTFIISDTQSNEVTIHYCRKYFMHDNGRLIHVNSPVQFHNNLSDEHISLSKTGKITRQKPKYVIINKKLLIIIGNSHILGLKNTYNVTSFENKKTGRGTYIYDNHIFIDGDSIHSTISSILNENLDIVNINFVEYCKKYNYFLHIVGFYKNNVIYRHGEEYIYYNYGSHQIVDPFFPKQDTKTDDINLLKKEIALLKLQFEKQKLDAHPQQIDSESVVADILSHVEKHVDDTNKCVICMTNNKEIIFNPCKHVSICQACNVNITTCPTCRSVIETSTRVFIS